MNVLLIEDEPKKRNDILAFLKNERLSDNIQYVKSVIGGKRALQHGYDCILLDMSLPLYEIDDFNDDLNEFEAFGGLDILAEIDRRELGVKVIVITAFDVIEDDAKSIRLEELDREMKEDYSHYYLGCIHYDQSSLEWKTELINYLTILENR